MSKDSPEPIKKNLGHPFVLIFWTLLIFLLSQFAALFITEAINAMVTGRVLSVDSLNSSAGAQFLYILLAEALVIGSVWGLLKQKKLGFSSIGLGRRPKLSDLGWTAVAFIAFIFCLLLITVVITGLWHGYDTNKLQDVGFNATINGTDKMIAFFSLVVLPPLGEEILMRGYLFSGLRFRWNFIAAGLVTSLLFGAAHLLTGADGLLWSAAVDTFVLSLFLVYMREKTGALYAGMGLHGLNNVLAFFVFFHS